MGRRTRNTRGGNALIARHLQWRLVPYWRNQLRQGHHATAGVAHIQPQDVVDLHAGWRVGLDDDLLHAALVREVVHIRRSHGRGQGFADGGERNTQRFRLNSVNIKTHAGSGRQAIGVDTGDQLVLRCQFQQLGLCGLEGCISLVGAIL